MGLKVSFNLVREIASACNHRPVKHNAKIIAKDNLLQSQKLFEYKMGGAPIHYTQLTVRTLRNYLF